MWAPGHIHSLTGNSPFSSHTQQHRVSEIKITHKTASQRVDKSEHISFLISDFVSFSSAESKSARWRSRARDREVGYDGLSLESLLCTGVELFVLTSRYFLSLSNELPQLSLLSMHFLSTALLIHSSREVAPLRLYFYILKANSYLELSKHGLTDCSPAAHRIK